MRLSINAGKGPCKLKSRLFGRSRLFDKKVCFSDENVGTFSTAILAHFENYDPLKRNYVNQNAVAL